MNKVVWITGASGGLGRGLVREFAQQGWRVAAAFHHKPHAIVDSDAIVALPLSVENRASAHAAARQIVAAWGQIDVLINNAGATADQLLTRTTEEEWDRIVNVNLKGAFNCSQSALEFMLAGKSGHIINIASFAAKTGARGQANYASAKAALIGLTLSLAKEMGPSNIQVNAILPGVLLTAMTAHLGPPHLERLARTNTLGRLNSIEEVARFTAFLATMTNISGQVLQLDSRIGRWA